MSRHLRTGIWPLTLSNSELHLLEYYQRGLQYLHYFGNTTTPPGTEPTELEAVSPPGDPDKYNDTSISGDTISAVYLQWVERTRQPESEQHLRTLTGECAMNYIICKTLTAAQHPRYLAILRCYFEGEKEGRHH